MVLDPIRLTEAPAVPDAAPARKDAVRAQTEKPPARPARAVQPIAPPPDTRDEIKVKWDRSDGVVVTFTDKKSGDIVRQIPSEQVLSVARFIRQLLEENTPAV
jgi:hypothetical protein